MNCFHTKSHGAEKVNEATLWSYSLLQFMQSRETLDAPHMTVGKSIMFVFTRLKNNDKNLLEQSIKNSLKYRLDF